MSNERVIDFTMLDQILHHFDRPAEPETIHIEVAVAGQLDTARLRRAAHEAAMRHPMATVRKRAGRKLRWEVTDAVEIDPVSVAANDVDVERDRFFSCPIPLDQTPTFRVLHVPDPGGDRVLISVNHSAMDGMGAIRLTRSIARSYAGAPDRVPDLDPLVVRDGSTLTGQTNGQSPRDGLRNIVRMASPKDSLASDGGDRLADGYGFHLRRLDAAQTAALRSRRGEGATANDVLVAAAHLAAHRWNVERDGGLRRITVTMPVNLRGGEWWEEIAANFSTQLVTSTDAKRSDPDAALGSVVEQTAQAKATRSAWGIYDLPDLLSRAVVGSLKLSERPAGDTIVLSNLGRPGEPLSFGPGLDVHELVFTPPCFVPMGIAIGVGWTQHAESVSTTLAFRRRRAMFDKQAGERFADLYLDCVDAIVG